MSARSASRCELTETYSPTAIDIAPATSPAIPAIRMAPWEAEDTRTPIMRLAVDTMASFDPSTAARNQPVRPLWCFSPSERLCRFAPCFDIGRCCSPFWTGKTTAAFRPNPQNRIASIKSIIDRLGIVGVDGDLLLVEQQFVLVVAGGQKQRDGEALLWRIPFHGFCRAIPSVE